MAGKKLTKLKSVLKKWNSFGRHSIRSSSSTSSSSDEDDYVPASDSSLRPVYVGKSRRRYLVGRDVSDHPLFRELVSRSGYDHGDPEGVSISCEVVLFDHLLWMLENGPDPLDSLRDLADFYTCR